MQLCFILKPKRYPKWHSNRSGSPSRICACARKPKTKKKRDFSFPRGPKPSTKNQKKWKSLQNCCFFRYKKKTHFGLHFLRFFDTSGRSWTSKIKQNHCRVVQNRWSHSLPKKLETCWKYHQNDAQKGVQKLKKFKKDAKRQHRKQV